MTIDIMLSPLLELPPVRKLIPALAAKAPTPAKTTASVVTLFLSFSSVVREGSIDQYEMSFIVKAISQRK